MTAELLRVTGLHAYYRESHVLHGVECHVQRLHLAIERGARIDGSAGADVDQQISMGHDPDGVIVGIDRER